MQHAAPLDKDAPSYSDFSARDLSMINDEPCVAPVNIAVIAEIRDLAQSWIEQTLSHCRPGVEADEARYGRFRFHACAYNQLLSVGDIHEAHVIVDAKAPGIWWQDVKPQARRVFFHHVGGAAAAVAPGGVHYLWDSREVGSAFCASLFSMLTRPGVIGLTWEDYADLLPDSAFARGLSCGAGELDAAISVLRDRIAGLPSARVKLALLHMYANGEFSLGDYVDVCSAAEESLPPLCRLIATVSITGRAKWFDVHLLLFAY
ncbi:hypothetical protein E5198_16525 [Pseudomonas sp. A-1]|uniref:hypothetical protein n=1 Tax=Pseudomonas sp. A-1 TaxID=1821274 RepID=UPI0010A648E2|nr:hypothetical protein [Pseudomonas sp. A-1]THG77586.1 hypothetical protein E5198_16525 [Pseudomonas sp. A-1]